MTDTTKPPPDTRTPQQIEADLVATRTRLVARIEQLQAYVEPKALLRRRVDRIRSSYVDEFGGIRPERVAATVAVAVAVVALCARRARRRR